LPQVEKCGPTDPDDDHEDAEDFDPVSHDMEPMTDQLLERDQKRSRILHWTSPWLDALA
jgi:hypothetical protein